MDIVFHKHKTTTDINRSKKTTMYPLV